MIDNKLSTTLYIMLHTRGCSWMFMDVYDPTPLSSDGEFIQDMHATEMKQVVVRYAGDLIYHHELVW